MSDQLLHFATHRGDAEVRQISGGNGEVWFHRDPRPLGPAHYLSDLEQSERLCSGGARSGAPPFVGSAMIGSCKLTLKATRSALPQSILIFPSKPCTDACV